MGAKIQIIGAGALGGLFAFRLSRAGHRVQLLGRQGPLPKLRLEGEGEAELVTEPLSPDLVVVAVKAYDTAAIAEQAAAPGVPVLTLQNGLGNAERLQAAGAPLLVGSTTFGATRLGPGHVRAGGDGLVRVGAWGGGGPSPQPWVQLLTEAGLTAEVADDVRGVLWQKVAVNCAINPIAALLGVTNGELLNRPSAVRLMGAVVEEVQQVAEVALPDALFDQVLAVAKATASNRCSMLQDLEAGRRTEIEALNGEVARRGVAPVNGALADLIRAKEKSRLA